jgi:hypothetical protein
MIEDLLGEYGRPQALPLPFRPRKGRDLLISLQQRRDIGIGDAERLECLSDVSAAIARDNFPAGVGSMKHNGEIALIGVCRAKRPIVRHGSVQSMSELCPDHFSHLFNIFGVAKVGGKGRAN